MIEKLNTTITDQQSGMVYQYPPTNSEIIAKLNEIIDFLNDQNRAD